MTTPRELDHDLRRQLVASYRTARRRLLLIDYDGTLKDFVDRPEDAAPDPQLLDLLYRLASSSGTEAIIVTGRPRTTMQDWLGPTGLGFSTEHGLRIRLREDTDWSGMFPSGYDPGWMDEVAVVLESYSERLPGSFVERKEASIGWHFRAVDSDALGRAPDELRSELRTLLRDREPPLEILAGKMIIEIRLRAVHKGNILSLLRERGRTYDFQLAIGDDATDENMFTALADDRSDGGSKYSLKVGPGPSAADFRLNDVAAARGLLAALAGYDPDA